MKESSPQPGPSSSTTIGGSECPLIDELHVMTENEEIDRLKLTEESKEPPPPPEAEDDRIPRISFHCDSCGMNEMVHYKGTEPPFVFGVKLIEDSYVMRDPFQPHPPRWRKKPEFFIILGTHCCLCERVVCRDAECSFYYASTFCLNCAKGAMKSFPLEVQTKLRKQLANIQRD